MFGVTLEAELSFRGGYWGEIPTYTHSLESQEGKNSLGRQGKDSREAGCEKLQRVGTPTGVLRTSLHLLGSSLKCEPSLPSRLCGISVPSMGKQLWELPHLLSAWCVWFLPGGLKSRLCWGH